MSNEKGINEAVSNIAKEAAKDLTAPMVVSKEKINIQNECAKIHNRFGTTEMANYRIQLLCDSYAQSQTTDLHEQIRVLQADKEIRDANQERLERVNRELAEALGLLIKHVPIGKDYLTEGESRDLAKAEQALENAKQ